MRTYTKTFDGVAVKAYNDGGGDWVVFMATSTQFRAMRFDRRRWTMKESMRFYAEIFK